MTHKRIKISLIILSAALILLLAACGGNKENQGEDDPNMAITQVFETAMAALTETAAVESPTPTITTTALPTFTTAPTQAVTPTSSTSLAAATSTSPVFVQPTSQTSSCDIGGFVSDVTIPDGTNMTAGEEFTKTWKIQNDGTCTWDENYSVIYYSGAQMADDTMYSFTTEDIEPGESVNISVPMTAPTSTGEYTSYWVLRNDLGQTFFINGGAIYVQITVGSPTAAPTATGMIGSAPDVDLTSPSNKATYSTSDQIQFSATATDVEDTTFPSTSFQWYDNDILLHTGQNFEASLTADTHTIKVRFTDSDGNVDSESITITVADPTAAP